MAKTPPRKRAEASALRRTGMSYREVAAKVGVSEGSVRKWEKVAAPAAQEPDAAPAAPAAQEPLPAGADALTRARHLQEKYFALAENAERDGNHTAASRALRDAGSQALLIARLEKSARETSDVVTFTRAELAVAQASLNQRMAALATVPLMCEGCAREMRVRSVKGE